MIVRKRLLTSLVNAIFMDAVVKPKKMLEKYKKRKTLETDRELEKPD